MEIIIWIALAFIVDATGPHAVAADSAYKTEAACMAQVKEAVRELVQSEEVLMLGAACVELHPKVTPAGDKVLKAGPKKSTQRDLEKSSDPAHGSKFRSTGHDSI